MTLEFAALTLPGTADPAIAIAASRAGSIGIVDVTLVADPRHAGDAVRALARYGRGRCGVRLDPRDEACVDAVAAARRAPVDLVVLTPAPADVLRRQVDRLRGAGAQVWCEATTVQDAVLGVDLGASAVIAKGHEAGGRVGETTTFVLLQQLLAQIERPVWAHGGIGEHTAAACAAAGAAGVVLDAQLALTRESGLRSTLEADLTRMDGSETVCVGQEAGERYRVYARRGTPAVEELRALERSLDRTEGSSRSRADRTEDGRARWRAGLSAAVHGGGVWLLGQDAAFAASLAARFHTVGGVLTGLRDAVEEHLAAVARLPLLAADGPLATSHGTRYPIVQGPMTRVSDVPGFAEQVAGAGALPFLALAVMRGPQIEELLRGTRDALGDRPWGVGILGFVPLELREEQLEVLRRYRPSFALIAGGRPDQALALERDGIATYLHVPSPGLLRMFTDAGARRFVFEGRECGGHVGPRTSFVLWNTMIGELLDGVAPADLPGCHVLFAGGIHDARSAAMVAAMAAPLAERGVRVGVLLGTAYLFTEEAVAVGAITLGFQRAALDCAHTVLLESGPGHATRCAHTAFAAQFAAEHRRLVAESRPPDEIRDDLERLNLGRLRIASKGIDRDPANPDGFVAVGADDQAEQGMYMIGQVAALRATTVALADLHHDVSAGGSALLAAAAAAPWPPRAAPAATPCDVAIIGMSCLLPKAPTVDAYWQNILDKVDAITEIPAERWDWQQYFDPDPRAPDKIYSRWGGFLDTIPFDPMRYGMPPSTLRSIEPMQLLTLEAVRAALDDAGYRDRPFARRQTGVVLGAGGVGDLGNKYVVRAALPGVVGQASQEVLDALPTWTEDSFPGILPNVAAGRVANRFDLGGINHTVDAACASSLAAVYLAVRELEAGTADVMIAGGADTMQSPFGYLCFSKTPALSPQGRSRPFDVSADGIVISEGVGVVVLKRLADAERDGDRIYGVIKGMGASSDGRDRGLTAPRPEGQALALERAYAKAGYSAATVGLVEAHGTGTVVGDRTEAQTLTRFFAAAGASAQSCAIGSVKSMIGHTKGSAGVAGLIKVALGLHHKVLPPTLGVEQPNTAAGFADGPLYVNTESRPWLRTPDELPRRAGVSAFGFGGTNFHLAVEEYADGYLPPATAPVQGWPSELFGWSAGSRAELRAALDALERGLDGAAEEPELRELAAAVWAPDDDDTDADAAVRLAVVATSVTDLRAKLATVRDVLAAGTDGIWERTGIYLSARPLGGEGALAFLYPGQGSQHPDMLRDLAISFPEVREAFEDADSALAGDGDRPLSTTIFAPPAFGPDGARARVAALTRTDRAQPALGAAGIALSRLLDAVGVVPDMTAGHSYGEYVALCRAGVFAPDVLHRLSQARGRSIIDACRGDLGTMAAVSTGPDRIQDVLRAWPDVWIANLNAPEQTVISGTRDGIERAVRALSAAGITAQPIPVACGFHSPLVAPARDKFAAELAGVELGTPRLPVFANTSAAPYPTDPDEIRGLLADHLVAPVRFAEQIEQMYAAGARVFVEAGPRAVLTGLVGQVLGSRPHLAVATQGAGGGLTAFQHALAQLHAHGVRLDLERLYRGRVGRALRLDALAQDLTLPPLTATTWMVDGGSARPLSEMGAGSRPAVPQAEFVPAAPAGPAPVTAQHRDPRPEAATDGHAQVPVPPPAANGHAQVPVPQVAAAAVPPVPAAPAVADGVVLQFQQLMSKFLDTQQEVMTAYLRGTDPTAPLAAPAPAAPAPVMFAPPVAPPPVPVAPVEQAPLAEAPPVPESVPATPATVPDVDEVVRELVRLAADRTGYPPEMLGLDADLEADLGIDSIKRIEILGAAQQAMPDSGDVLSGGMETLAAARTLRALAEAIVAMLGTDAHPHTDPLGDEPTGPARPDEVATLPRFTPTVLDAPSGSPAQPLAGTVVITDDGHGVAAGLATSLRAGGVEVVLIGADEVADADAARALAASIQRRHGPVSALVHLLPLRAAPAFTDLDANRWRAQLDRETRTLLHLVQALDLRRAGATTRLLAAVRLDGAFGHAGATTASPSHGGVVGLVKTLAAEWPEVACRVVDLGAESVEDVERLAAELQTADDRVEIGWTGGRRVTIGLAPASLPSVSFGDDRSTPLDEDSVVLVTGGARGITARVSRELARRYRPTLVLVGRSALPDGAEPADTAGITDARELKAALTARLASDAGGAPATPAQVEPAYRRLLGDREMRATCAAVTAAGARVAYHQVDVRDPAAVTRLVAEVYAKHGRIDGVIHGAGVIEDRRIEDKTADSFDRVLHTKAVSAFALARALRPESLRFLVLFSSISARFGNPGQCDYAAANEVLDKLACRLDADWPGRVAALQWGPWAAGGMVSEPVRRGFAERGIELIDPDRGVAALVDELDRGRKGDVEVLLGAGPWQVAGPLLDGGTTVAVPGGIEITRMLDPERDRYLDDHRLDGHPVLPAAGAMELMAEVATAARPGMELAELRDVQILSGVVLDEGPREVTVRAVGGPAGDVDLTVLDSRTGRAAYRAGALLVAALAPAPPDTGPALRPLEPYPMTPAQVYDELLFHGPLMQGITSIEGICDDGMVAMLAPSSPQRCVTGAGRWIVDPVLVDSGFQLCVLWARARLDVTPLPARIRRYRRFAAVGDGPVRCELRARMRPGGLLLDTQYTFSDVQGRLLAVIEDMEGACSRSLNRLAIGGAR